MTLGTATEPALLRIRAAYGLSETGSAFADPDLSSEATFSDPAYSLPVVHLTGDLSDELLSLLETTLGGF